MKVVLQRVTRASVTIEKRMVGSIGVVFNSFGFVDAVPKSFVTYTPYKISQEVYSYQLNHEVFFSLYKNSIIYEYLKDKCGIR